MATTKQEVLNQFNRYKMPFFAIYSGKDRVCINETNDLEEAQEILDTYLDGETKSVKIKIYKALPKGGITEKSEPHIVIPFEKRYTQEDKAQYYGMQGVGGVLFQKLETIENRIAGLEAEPATDEELSEEAEPNGILAGILGNPAVQNILSNFLTNISANIVTPHIAKPMSMAGTDEKVSLETIIETLLSKGVTIDDIHKLSQMPKEKLSFLLGMLRNQ